MAVFCPNCGASTIPARGATPVLPGYTILRTLGRGGAAVVYLARQEALDRQVAVKVLRRDVEDPKVWREFRREAHAIARLSAHPHVVTVYTAGRSLVGQPYLVSEYLDRGSLGDVIADGPLDAENVATIGVAVADALSAAHDAGILHRDVKPGNVLLGHDGRIKLGDFGIARLLVGQSAATTDQIAFTPEHVAPEILRNEPEGPWSDVYGLASTLATALVGRPPFQQRPGERMDAFLSRKVLAPPPVLSHTVPAALAGPVTRALDPEPSRRPSVTELREQLAEARRSLDRSVPLPPPGPELPTRPPSPTAPLPATDPTGSDTQPSDTQSQIVTRSSDGQLVASRPGRLGRRRRETLPVLIAVLFTALAITALGVVLLTVDDGGVGQNSSSTASSIAAARRRDRAPGPASTMPASPVISAAPPTLPPATTAAAPGALSPPPTAAALPTSPTTAITSAPTTSPPTASPSAAPAITTPAEADSFVRDYYDAVAAGDYARSWAQLTPEFQHGKARSYEYYVEFWDDNDITVDAVELVDADPSRVIVDVELRWNGSSEAVVDRFELHRTPDGQLLIAGQDTVG